MTPPLARLEELLPVSVYNWTELLHLYVLEGIVRRMAASDYKDIFVLRGGMMSRHWYAPGKWMPSDIDFMVQIPLPVPEMEEIWLEILSQDRPEADGLFFVTESLTSEVIWAEAKDPGLRLFIVAFLEGLEHEIQAQVDISYADPVVPEPEFQAYTCLLPGQEIYVKTSQPAGEAGWKFYGLFERKNERWRPKDLFGLYWLLMHHELDAALVMESFRETSIERGTPLGVAARFFEQQFAQGKGSQRLWRSFCAAHPSFNLPDHLPEVLAAIQARLQPFFMKMIAEYSQIVALGDRGFPMIERMDMVLLAIRNRDEFQVYERESYQIIDYRRALKYSFLSVAKAIHSSVASIYALRRECRGLIFDKNGTLVHRKLHKFFSIGELEETRLENIDWSMPCRVLEKLDGSLVAPVIWNHTLRWTTRKGLSAIADQADAFAQEMTQQWQASHPERGYLPMIHELLRNGWTPCFEWCSRQHPIVLDHSEDKLVLTAVRNNLTGVYLAYDTMVVLAKKHHIPCVKQVGELRNEEEARQFIDHVAAERMGEGYVLRFPDDRFYKVKNQWYIRLHQLVANPRNEWYIWQATLAGKIEEMLQAVAPGLQTDIRAFVALLAQTIEAEAAWLENFIRNACQEIELRTPDTTEANKLFSIHYAQPLEAVRRMVTFTAWHTYRVRKAETDFRHILQEFMVYNCTSRRRMEKLRSLINIRFDEDRFFTFVSGVQQDDTDV